MKKILLSLAIVFGLVLPGLASAHVTVKPGDVGVGQRLNFVVSVPTEEETPTIGLRVVIPEGVESVRPNVKPGWNVELKKSGSGEEERVSEIIWSGGKIPPEQRDEFIFSAQAPANSGTIVWKAYQTYGDGDVVAWDNDPVVVAEYTKNNPPKDGEEDDHNAPRPWSETKVVDDLQVDSSAPNQTSTDSSANKNLLYASLALSIAALIAAGYALGRKS